MTDMDSDSDSDSDSIERLRGEMSDLAGERTGRSTTEHHRVVINCSSEGEMRMLLKCVRGYKYPALAIIRAMRSGGGT